MTSNNCRMPANAADAVRTHCKTPVLGESTRCHDIAVGREEGAEQMSCDTWGKCLRTVHMVAEDLHIVGFLFVVRTGRD